MWPARRCSASIIPGTLLGEIRPPSGLEPPRDARGAVALDVEVEPMRRGRTSCLWATVDVGKP
jgi:hypothetical protein